MAKSNCLSNYLLRCWLFLVIFRLFLVVLSHNAVDLPLQRRQAVSRQAKLSRRSVVAIAVFYVAYLYELRL